MHSAAVLRSVYFIWFFIVLYQAATRQLASFHQIFTLFSKIKVAVFVYLFYY